MQFVDLVREAEQAVSPEAYLSVEVTFRHGYCGYEPTLTFTIYTVAKPGLPSHHITADRADLALAKLYEALGRGGADLAGVGPVPEPAASPEGLSGAVEDRL